MHTRLRFWLLLALAALLALGTDRIVGVSAQAAEPDSAWANLGPPGSRVTAFGLAASWPSDPTIISALASDSSRTTVMEREIARTFDGGLTWELVPWSGPELRQIVVTDRRPAGRIVFAMDDWRLSTGRSLYRSADGGATWNETFSLPIVDERARGRREIVISPNFVADGMALLVADGALHRSNDGGETWGRVEMPAGQRAQQAIFSPNFDADGTIFLASTSADIPSFVGTAPRHSDPLPTDHERSLGVLRSTDRGATWQQAATGLEIDGQPYRHIMDLAISPTYGQDGIVFAFAWGPWLDEPAGSMTMRAVRTALFRTANGASSWSPVLAPNWRPTTSGITLSPGYSVRVGLSRNFVSDGTGLLLLNWYGLGGGAGSCSVLRTADRGASWSRIDARGLAELSTCWPMLTTGDAANMVVYTSQAPKFSLSPVWSRSDQEGRTWERIARPFFRPNEPEARVAKDGTIFFGEKGIWALGPSARPAGGNGP